MGNVCAVMGAVLLACIILMNQFLDYRKSMTCGEGWNSAVRGVVFLMTRIG